MEYQIIRPSLFLPSPRVRLEFLYISQRPFTGLEVGQSFMIQTVPPGLFQRVGASRHELVLSKGFGLVAAVVVDILPGEVKHYALTCFRGSPWYAGGCGATRQQGKAELAELYLRGSDARHLQWTFHVHISSSSSSSLTQTSTSRLALQLWQQSG